MDTQQTPPRDPAAPPRIVGDDGEFVFELPPPIPSPLPSAPRPPRYITLRAWQLVALILVILVGVVLALRDRLVQQPRPYGLTLEVNARLNLERPINASSLPVCEFPGAIALEDLRIVLANGNVWSNDSSLYLLSPSGDDVCQMDVTLNARAPQWAPDKMHILYAGWTQNYTGSGPHTWSPPNHILALTQESLYIQSPHWSPDGLSVFFVADQGLHQLPVMSQPPLPQPERILPFFMVPDAAISPDGQSVAFISSPSGVSGADLTRNWELYVSRFDEPAMRRLTHNEVSDSAPTWSPDGRWLAWISDSDVWLYDLVEDTRTKFFDGGTRETSSPVWLPTNDGIAFVLHTLETRALVAQMFNGELRVITGDFPMLTSFDWR